MQIYAKVLDADDTSTGGGSASAVAGAMAGALLAMVSRLSAPPGETEDSPLFARVYAQSKEVSRQLQVGSGEDSRAFQLVRAAYQLPRQTDEEKASRQQAVQDAWQVAARTPLGNAQRCLQVLELGAELAGKVNPKVMSDYTCGLLLARAGLLGCLENVAINLPALKDAALAEQLAEQAAGMRSRCDGLSAR